MYSLSLLLALLVGLHAVLGSPVRSRSPYTVKETHYVPNKWSKVADANPEQVINLQIGLKQVSDPDHQRYGQHLSKVEVEELVRPSAQTSNAVSEWLLENGVDAEDCSFSSARDWITIALSVKDIEKLLDTKYAVYQHEDGTTIARTTEWSLPRHLHDHISTIQPTTAFLRTNPLGKKVKKSVESIVVEGDYGPPTTYVPPENITGIDAVCNFSAVSPDCLRTLYQTIDYTPQVPGQNQIGLNDFLGETNNRSDTAIFLKMFRPEALAAAESFTQISIAGGSLQQTPNDTVGFEGNLDIETILGIVWPTPATAFSTGGSPPFKPDLFAPIDTNEPYLTWVTWALNQSSLPQVISTSYGDDEQTVPYSYATTVCSLFAQLGARGVTLLFGSGDEGVGASGDCFTNDSKKTPTFLPAFPASCPYITAVGGTKDFPEVVAFDPKNAFASGGGFSNYFSRPRYQDEVVSRYIASLGGEFDGLYNRSGRGIPDIAAQAYKYLTIHNGSVVPLDGTSCATPTASSVLSLVNDALLAAGKPVLGFINPWLYKKGYKAFVDVVSGSAIGCNVTGFPAKAGWDAVSGFGTPLFPAIEALALEGRDEQWPYP